MIESKPVRFLVLVLVAWGTGRTVAYRLVTPTTPTARADVAVPKLAAVPIAGRARHRTVTMAFEIAGSQTIVVRSREPAPGNVAAPTARGRASVAMNMRPRRDPPDPAPIARDRTQDMVAGSPPLLATLRLPQTWPSTAPAPAMRPAAGKRWSGFAYIFHRPGGGGDPLVPAGQLGGSQAAARIAWAIAPGAPIALAVRASAALGHPHQAELAPALDILPLPALPIRFTVERRIAIGRGGRNAWSAFAAGGLYRSLARDVDLDGYAQAGIVGTRRRDGFVDGAIRVAQRTRIADGIDLRLGGGLWGAAQPQVARIDIGPRAALSARLPLPVTLAIEGRVRIAGAARPGSGVALTLATDF